jgi:hypothetical protein
MLDGSGVTVLVTTKVPAPPKGVPGPPTWVKLTLKSDRKGPPVTPPCVPGVHNPAIARFREFGVDRPAVIEVDLKVPKMGLPKIRPLVMAVLIVTLPKLWGFMLAKTPVPNVEFQFPTVMTVALVMLGVLAVVGGKAPKTTCPIVLACTLVVADKQIASTDTPKRIIERIADLLVEGCQLSEVYLSDIELSHRQANLM